MILFFCAFCPSLLLWQRLLSSVWLKIHKCTRHQQSEREREDGTLAHKNYFGTMSTQKPCRLLFSCSVNSAAHHHIFYWKVGIGPLVSLIVSKLCFVCSKRLYRLRFLQQIQSHLSSVCHAVDNVKQTKALAKILLKSTINSGSFLCTLSLSVARLLYLFIASLSLFLRWLRHSGLVYLNFDWIHFEWRYEVFELMLWILWCGKRVCGQRIKTTQNLLNETIENEFSYRNESQ